MDLGPSAPSGSSHSTFTSGPGRALIATLLILLATIAFNPVAVSAKPRAKFSPKGIIKGSLPVLASSALYLGLDSLSAESDGLSDTLMTLIIATISLPLLTPPLSPRPRRRSNLATCAPSSTNWYSAPTLPVIKTDPMSSVPRKTPKLALSAVALIRNHLHFDSPSHPPLYSDFSAMDIDSPPTGTAPVAPVLMLSLESSLPPDPSGDDLPAASPPRTPDTVYSSFPPNSAPATPSSTDRTTPDFVVTLDDTPTATPPDAGSPAGAPTIPYGAGRSAENRGGHRGHGSRPASNRQTLFPALPHPLPTCPSPCVGSSAVLARAHLLVWTCSTPLDDWPGDWMEEVGSAGRTTATWPHLSVCPAAVSSSLVRPPTLCTITRSGK
ncbi:hypothetical protein GPALN_004473 [Globodera pallida]|nr:hypothetical protein GPALN_004473 [Globodera pallida]